MAGTLFVVATPIGNLEDITLRALRVLREVALVAAEDTRRTGNLLRHYQIDTPLLSVHEHNEHERLEQLTRRLRTGESIALVSDAGTPGISDPGARLVAAARDAGCRVEPIPGASSITAILSASGIRFSRFAFAGFPPIGSKDRKEWFDWVAAHADIPVVGFEAPHRIERTLSDLGDRPIILARELTKMHEEWWVGPADTFRDLGRDARGEFVFVATPLAPDQTPKQIPDDAEIAAVFGRTTELIDDSRREAIKATAERLGLSPKAVYAALERHKNSAS